MVHTDGLVQDKVHKYSRVLQVGFFFSSVEPRIAVSDSGKNKAPDMNEVCLLREELICRFSP